MAFDSITDQDDGNPKSALASNMSSAGAEKDTDGVLDLSLPRTRRLAPSPTSTPPVAQSLHPSTSAHAHNTNNGGESKSRAEENGSHRSVGPDHQLQSGSPDDKQSSAGTSTGHLAQGVPSIAPYPPYPFPFTPSLLFSPQLMSLYSGASPYSGLWNTPLVGLPSPILTSTPSAVWNGSVLPGKSLSSSSSASSTTERHSRGDQSRVSNKQLGDSAGTQHQKLSAHSHQRDRSSSHSNHRKPTKATCSSSQGKGSDKCSNSLDQLSSLVCKVGQRGRLNSIQDNLAVEGTPLTSSEKDAPGPGVSMEDLWWKYIKKEESVELKRMSEAKQIFTCLQCQGSFQSMDQLVSHMKLTQHFDNIPRSYSQALQYTRQRMRQMRLKLKYSEKMMYLCNICGVTFSGPVHAHFADFHDMHNPVDNMQFIQVIQMPPSALAHPDSPSPHPHTPSHDSLESRDGNTLQSRTSQQSPSSCSSSQYANSPPASSPPPMIRPLAGSLQHRPFTQPPSGTNHPDKDLRGKIGIKREHGDRGWKSEERFADTLLHKMEKCVQNLTSEKQSANLGHQPNTPSPPAALHLPGVLSSLRK